MPVANLDDNTTAADDFTCFAVLVNLTQPRPLTKLFVVFHLIDSSTHTRTAH